MSDIKRTFLAGLVVAGILLLMPFYFNLIGYNNLSSDSDNNALSQNIHEEKKKPFDVPKKDLVNLIYMQLGFSKQISENLIEDFFQTIIFNLKREKSLKLSNFGTFLIREKKSRIGRNPKTKERKVISKRNVVLFKPSKEFKDFVNLKNE